jgi:hypothetical protein
MAALHKLTGNFTEAVVDDEIIIMRLDNGELLSLIGTAATVWRLIDGSRDRDALVTALGAEFDADEQLITRDVGELLHQLKEAGLVAEG